MEHFLVHLMAIAFRATSSSPPLQYLLEVVKYGLVAMVSSIAGGPGVMVATGILARETGMNIYAVVILSSVGLTANDAWVYHLGSWLENGTGPRLVQFVAKLLGLLYRVFRVLYRCFKYILRFVRLSKFVPSLESLDSLLVQAQLVRIKKYRPLQLFYGKIMPGAGLLVLMALGLSKWRFRTYLAWSMAYSLVMGWFLVRTGNRIPNEIIKLLPHWWERRLFFALAIVAWIAFMSRDAIKDAIVNTSKKLWLRLKGAVAPLS